MSTGDREIIHELSRFNGGWHERPEDDETMQRLKAEGYVVLCHGRSGIVFWSPTLAGIDFEREVQA